MSSFAASRCQHIKVSGTQCGSPALRSKKYCFYHQQNRPIPVECYSQGEYATGEIDLPYFEDAHSVQAVIRQVVQMVLQKRIERKTASVLLYALQIASSNLKRMDSRSRNQSRLSPILTRYRKLPWPTAERPRAKLQPASHQQIALKKLAKSAAKTFRPAPSRPVIAPDHKPGIALATVKRHGSNM